MRYLSFSIDNRALTTQEEGHSCRWHRKLGQHMEQVDVLVECRQSSGLTIRNLASNVRIIPICPPTGHLYPLYGLRWALEAHKTMHYDIVTSEDPFRPGLAAALFKRMRGVAYCAEYHTECFFNRAWRQQRPMINGTYDIIGKWAVRQADSVRCVNQKNLRQIRKICSNQPRKLIEIHPVPSVFYDPAIHQAPAQALRRELLGDGPQSDGPLLLFVGRIEPVKNVDRLVKLFAQLEHEHPQAHLVIVGDGSQRQACQDLASSLGCQRIHFVGYIPENKIYPYYGAADLLVNACDVETYGRVYIEALSARCAVISTQDAGAVEDGLVVEGETGLTFQPGNEQEIYEKMLRLTRQSDLREKLADAGQKRVQEKFNYDVAVKDMIDLWQRTIQAASQTK